MKRKINVRTHKRKTKKGFVPVRKHTKQITKKRKNYSKMKDKNFSSGFEEVLTPEEIRLFNKLARGEPLTKREKEIYDNPLKSMNFRSWPANLTSDEREQVLRLKKAIQLERERGELPARKNWAIKVDPEYIEEKEGKIQSIFKRAERRL